MRVRGWTILMAFATSWSFARGEEEPLARFLREYPAAARRLEGGLTRIKGSCRVTRAIEGAARPIRVDEISFAFDHGRELARIRKRSPSNGSDAVQAEIVYGVGKEGTFWLQRPIGAKEYSVRGTGQDAARVGAYNTIFGQYPKAAFAIVGLPLSGLLAHSGFHASDAERTTRDGRALVKVDGRMGPEGSKSRASIEFDPDAGWVIRSVDFRLGSPTDPRIKFDVEYGPPGDGPPLPRLVVFRDGTAATWRCEFGEWLAAPTPEAEFKMTHYGLPDLLDKRGARRWSLPFWLAAAAAGGLVLAYVLRRLAARRGAWGNPKARGSLSPS